MGNAPALTPLPNNNAHKNHKDVASQTAIKEHLDHKTARASITHPALLEAFDHDWFYPWPPEYWPDEDRKHPLVQKAVKEGWAEWIQDQADLEAVKQGFYYDLSRDRKGRPVFWHQGRWVRWTGKGKYRQLEEIPIEQAEHANLEKREVVHYGAGDLRCRFIELFIVYTKASMASEPGDPYRFIYWQRLVLLSVFGWVRDYTDRKGKVIQVRRFRKAWLMFPKKQGKSDFVSAITIIMLKGDRQKKAYIYGAACDKEQAGVVFREAKDYVEKSHYLSDLLFINDSRVDRRISDFASGSFYQVVSSDVASKDGVDAQGVIHDEIHQHRDRKLYVIFKRAGQARLQPLEWVITTYGRTLKSIWGEIYLKAKAILSGAAIKISHYVMIASAEPITVVITSPAKVGDTILHVHRLEQSIDAGEVIRFESADPAKPNTTVITAAPAKRFQRFLEVHPVGLKPPEPTAPAEGSSTKPKPKTPSASAVGSLSSDVIAIPDLSEGRANESALDPERLDHAIRRSNPSCDIVMPHERIKEEILDAEGPQGEAEAKRFNLNIIAGDGNLWLSGAAWLAGGRKKIVRSSLLGSRCFGGMDVSQSNDLTAFWLSFPNWERSKKFGSITNPQLTLLGLVWVPEADIEKREEVEEIPYRALAQAKYFGKFGFVRICPGETIRYDQVGKDIVEFCNYFKVQCVAYDTHRAADIVEDYLMPGGLTCIPHRQGALTMGPAAMKFENLVKRRSIIHGNHPLLDAAVEGCILTNPDQAGNRYPAKDKSISRIDPLIAAIMATNWACHPPKDMPSGGAYASR